MAPTFTPEASVFFQVIGELFLLVIVRKEVEREIAELSLYIRPGQPLAIKKDIKSFISLSYNSIPSI